MSHPTQPEPRPEPQAQWNASTALAPPPEPGAHKHRGTWSLSAAAVRTVVRLELRQRVRSSRWRLMLGLFFGTIAVISSLTMLAAGFDQGSGTFLFGAIAFLVLTLGLLVAPALSSTSVNGDRAAGTLAPLQMTLLTPLEIATGKLLAAWITALVFLATSLPFLLLAMVPGGTSPLRFLATVVMLSVILLAVCAMALGWSAVTARPASSAVMTYLTVAFLCIGTLIFFGVSYPLVTTTDQVQVLVDPANAYRSDGAPVQIPESECVVTVEPRERAHTEFTWWLLAANPYVVVADAAPAQGHTDDVLAAIAQGVAVAQHGAEEPVNECYASRDYGSDFMFGVDDPRPGIVWPFGLAINLGLGALGFWRTVRRLEIPVRRLARGTRIA